MTGYSQPPYPPQQAAQVPPQQWAQPPVPQHTGATIQQAGASQAPPQGSSATAYHPAATAAVQEYMSRAWGDSIEWGGYDPNAAAAAADPWEESGTHQAPPQQQAAAAAAATAAPGQPITAGQLATMFGFPIYDQAGNLIVPSPAVVASTGWGHNLPAQLPQSAAGGQATQPPQPQQPAAADGAQAAAGQANVRVQLSNKPEQKKGYVPPTCPPTAGARRLGRARPKSSQLVPDTTPHAATRGDQQAEDTGSAPPWAGAGGDSSSHPQEGRRQTLPTARSKGAAGDDYARALYTSHNRSGPAKLCRARLSTSGSRRGRRA